MRVLLRIFIVAVLVAVTAGPAGGQSLDDARRQREGAGERRAGVEAELDGLQASDAELRGAVDDLDARIDEGEQTVATARAAQRDAEAELEALRDEIDDARREVDDRTDLVHDRAVAAYMQGGAVSLVSLIGSSDINEVGTKELMLRKVAEHDRRLLGELLAAQDTLETHEVAADDARARAAEQAAVADAALAELGTARAERIAARKILQERIAASVAESEALAAEEAELTALIAEREAEVAAAEQRAAEERAAAEQAAADEAEAAEEDEATAEAPSGDDDRGSSSQAPSGTSDPSDRPAASSGRLQRPTSGPITSPFGWRWGRMHQGIDIGAPTGRAIVAAESGEVFYSGSLGGYGQAVLVDHGGGLVTLYAHQSRRAASVGESVGRGEVIGYVGSTGNSTGPHLHFETRVNGTPRNPQQYL